ncbi:Ribonuclease H domain [Macleaya cordata]|uniref:Ribonuclease H domain n=1 Tax=Macleaya cordata TaxID=56857 RepID=A0A200Q969_MACCD|nr:Ribonuclease H domain [Macleaya cordata]
MVSDLPSSSRSPSESLDPSKSQGVSRSYADKVRPPRILSSVDISSLPAPSRRGDFPAILLPDDLYESCLEDLKFSLIGRLDFKTLKFEDAKSRLLQLWPLKGSCKFIPLGKGFFTIKLENEDDKRLVWSGGPWDVDQQYLRVREWEPCFNPEKQRVSSSFVWVRLPGLGMEYWKEESLLTIGKNGGFWQKVEILRPPKFCNHCKIVGHIVSECRAIREVLQNNVVEDQNVEVQKNKKKRNRKGKQNEIIGDVDPTLVVIESSNDENKKLGTNVELVPADTNDKSETSNKFAALAEEGNEELHDDTDAIGNSKNGIGSAGAEDEAKAIELWSDTVDLEGKITAEIQKAKKKTQKSGNNSVSLELNLRDMNSTIINNSDHCRKDSCNLLEVQNSGIYFTWCNNQTGDRRIYGKLDRVLYNPLWIEKFESWTYRSLPRHLSDHSPLVGSCVKFPRPRNCPFKFQSMWISYPSYNQLVKGNWDEPLFGSPVYVFTQKLKRLKEVLKVWNRNVFGDIVHQFKEKDKLVEEAMLISDGDPHNLDNLANLVAAQRDLEESAQRYDKFLRQKVKVSWYKEGESNTKLFHTMIKVRSATNSITRIQTDEGDQLCTQENIAQHAVSYFEQKVRSHPGHMNDYLLDRIPCLVSMEDNNTLNNVPMWVMTTSVSSILDKMGVNFTSLPSPSNENDERIWKHSPCGVFSVNSGFDIIRDHMPNVTWSKWIWNKSIHPRLAAQTWKLFQGSAATEERMKKIGINLASKCYLCGNNCDSMDHIFWGCRFMDEIWDWIHNLFNLRRGNCFTDIMNCAKLKSEAVRQAWNVASLSSMTEVWLSRNRVYFDGVSPSIRATKIKILERVRCSAIRIKGNMFNSVNDLLILNSLGIGARSVMSRKIIDCYWVPPPLGYLKISCDGAARGNPGAAGAGVIIRNHLSFVVATISQGLGSCSNYIAEVVAIVLGLEWAASNHHSKIWVVSDSNLAIHSFKANMVPWFARGRWNAVKGYFHDIFFSHIYREVNFAADSLAKKGSFLDQGVSILSVGCPDQLVLEMPDKVYFRFG